MPSLFFYASVLLAQDQAMVTHLCIIIYFFPMVFTILFPPCHILDRNPFRSHRADPGCSLLDPIVLVWVISRYLNSRRPANPFQRSKRKHSKADSYNSPPPQPQPESESYEEAIEAETWPPPSFLFTINGLPVNDEPTQVSGLI